MTIYEKLISRANNIKGLEEKTESIASDIGLKDYLIEVKAEIQKAIQIINQDTQDKPKEPIKEEGDAIDCKDNNTSSDRASDLDGGKSAVSC
jgi:hypothetical protein